MSVKLYDNSQIFCMIKRVAPFAIQKVVLASPDVTETTQIDTALFRVLPVKGTVSFHNTCELKKILIKPHRFQIVRKKVLNTAYQVDDNKDESYLAEDKNYGATYMPDTYEAIVIFKINSKQFPVTGLDGVILSTRNRIAEFDLTDPDGNGILIPAGTELDYEIMVLDVSGIQALKSTCMQSGNYVDTKYVVKYWRNGDAFIYPGRYTAFNPDKPGVYCPQGISATALPTILQTSLDALVEKGKLPEDLLQSDVIPLDNIPDSNRNEVIEHHFGKPVDLIFTGLYLTKNACKTV